MVRHMTENYQCSEGEIKTYVVEAIKQAEITYKVKNNDIEESSELSDSILRACKDIVHEKGGRENVNKNKSKFNKLMDRVTKMSNDPNIRAEAGKREEGRKKGRLASESDMMEKASNPKQVRKSSPKMK